MFSKEDALKAIDREKEFVCCASDKIWDNPETAFQEFKSTEILCELLEKEGFAVEKNLAGIKTAFSGSFGHGRPVIGLLGEFDALSGLSQESENTNKVPVEEGAPGHGCGHNLLGAGALAAAIAVKEYLEKNQKEGTVIYFGCPGEEGGSGKSFMARDGVFDKLDCAITWHPSDSNQVSVGSSLANYQVIYRYYGTAAHAAACPEMGRSALDAVELMNTGVQYLREHMIQEARIHYAITNTGGYSPNVVQPYAEVLYLIRAPKNAQVKELFERVKNVARGASIMTDTEMNCELAMAFTEYIPNNALAAVADECLKEVGAPKWDEADYELAKTFLHTFPEITMESIRNQIIETYGEDRLEEIMERPLDSEIHPFSPDKVKLTAGSTDVGDVGYAAPTLNICVATACVGNVGHSWQMVAQSCSPIAHKGLLTAAKVMALSCIRTMDRPDVIEAAKKEVTKRNGGHYTCPLPDSVKPPLDTY